MGLISYSLDTQSVWLTQQMVNDTRYLMNLNTGAGGARVGALFSEPETVFVFELKSKFEFGYQDRDPAYYHIPRCLGVSVGRDNDTITSENIYWLTIPPEMTNTQLNEGREIWEPGDMVVCVPFLEGYAIISEPRHTLRPAMYNKTQPAVIDDSANEGELVYVHVNWIGDEPTGDEYDGAIMMQCDLTTLEWWVFACLGKTTELT